MSPWGTAASNTIDTSTGIPRAAAELRGVRARTIRTRRVQPLSLIVMDYHSSNRYIRSAPPFCIRMSSALRCIILATLHAKQHSEDTPVRPTLGVSRSITCGQCPTGYLQRCGERVFDVRGLPRALPADSGRVSERLMAGGYRMLGCFNLRKVRAVGPRELARCERWKSRAFVLSFCAVAMCMFTRWVAQVGFNTTGARQVHTELGFLPSISKMLAGGQHETQSHQQLIIFSVSTNSCS